MKSKHNLLAALLGLTCLGSAMSFAETPPQGQTGEEPCYMKNQDGECLDDAHIPGTGQFDHFTTTPSDDIRPSLRDTQHHANVKLTDDTFVFAHNICRWVGNPSTDGRAFFIGLEKKTEWVSFIDHPPVGAELELCCKPVVISRCGETISLGFGKLGKTYGPFTSGHDFRSTYRCVTGVDGSGATQDTSWAESSTGSCEDTTTGGNGGGGGQGQGNGGESGGGESRDGNGDGHGDGATHGDPAKGNDGACGGGAC